VTLAGDAAHPMVPFRAQGLNNAMRDSFGYVEAMRSIVSGTSTLDAAIKEYSDEVFGRGAQEIAMSNAFGPLFHNWEALMQSPIMKLTYGKQDAAPAAQKEAVPATNGHSVAGTDEKAEVGTRDTTELSEKPALAGVATPIAAASAVLVTEVSKESTATSTALDEPIGDGSATTTTKDEATAAELESDSDSQAATVLASPETASEPFATPVPSSDSTPLAENTKLSAERPNYEWLMAENEKLRALNADLVKKLFDITSILGGGISLDKAQSMLDGDEGIVV
jgi:hypothetical protein